MPELPEVETVRRALHPVVKGRTIDGVSLRAFPEVLQSSIPGVSPLDSLPGQVIVGALRRGKYLLFPFQSGLTLVVHLRMTGRLLLVRADAPPIRFEHLAVHLDDGHDLRFADQRKFGRVCLSSPDDVEALDRKLGPEPDDRRLKATGLHGALSRRPGGIKPALLDQSLIAGLGNIYVDEALFRSRIHPQRPARELSVDDVGRLLRAIRVVLNLGLRHRGTTFSSFETPYGEPGGNQAFLKAYGRAGIACPRCGLPLQRIVVAGRGTTFCTKCQPANPSPVAPGAGNS